MKWLLCALFGHRKAISTYEVLVPNSYMFAVYFKVTCSRCGRVLYDGPAPPQHPNCRCTSVLDA